MTAGVVFLVLIISILFVGGGSIFFAFKVLFYLIISPYSFTAVLFTIGLGIIGEAAGGFEKGWFERLIETWWFATLILAAIGELVLTVLFDVEPYFYNIMG